jgi:hypothetical protein
MSNFSVPKRAVATGDERVLRAAVAAYLMVTFPDSAGKCICTFAYARAKLLKVMF